MKTKQLIGSEHRLKVYPISMTPAMAGTIKEQSKKMSGCPRPNDGSLSHGIFVLSMQFIDKINPNLKKCNPEIYNKIN